KKIDDVVVTYEKETPGVGGHLKNSKGEILLVGGEAPITLIPKKIVKYQSTNVDAVSGATVTSDAIKIATKNALKKAGATQNDFSKICRDDIEVKDIDTDILIVGGGGAGLASAISASNYNKRMLIIEKNGNVGGDTLVCGAIYNTPDKELQSKIETNATINKAIDVALSEEPINEKHKALINEVKEEYEAHNKENKKILYDSPSWYQLQTWNGGDKIADLGLLKKFVDNSYKSYQWLRELGVEFYDFASQAAGALWQRSHTTKMDMGTGLISAYLENIAEDDNIDIMLDTKCIELIYDGEKIIGAKCVSKDNQEFVINCKSLILATGGFAANSDMIEKYNTSGKWDSLKMAMT
ncbi:MAG: FAD-dependent oxidoreductase, partial [Lachnospiraceae bacterium]|nr:FAD-dependent oxidoreductase [Lachnospiraceae bacterium]